jgi:hypothetical protein
MNRISSQSDAPPSAPVGSDEPPGIPGLRSWGRVYALVVIGFLVGLILLALLPRFAA